MATTTTSLRDPNQNGYIVPIGKLWRIALVLALATGCQSAQERHVARLIEALLERSPFAVAFLDMGATLARGCLTGKCA